MLAMAKSPKKRIVYTPKKIRELRELNGWTVAYCAEQVGVAERTWRYWELPKQNRFPSPSHVILLDLLFSKKLPG